MRPDPIKTWSNRGVGTKSSSTDGSVLQRKACCDVCVKYLVVLNDRLAQSGAHANFLSRAVVSKTPGTNICRSDGLTMCTPAQSSPARVRPPGCLPQAWHPHPVPSVQDEPQLAGRLVFCDSVRKFCGFKPAFIRVISTRYCKVLLSDFFQNSEKSHFSCPSASAVLRLRGVLVSSCASVFRPLFK